MAPTKKVLVVALSTSNAGSYRGYFTRYKNNSIPENGSTSMPVYNTPDFDMNVYQYRSEIRVQNRILMSSGSNDSQEEIILTCENESAHSEDSGDNVHNIPYESAAKYQGACDRMVTGESTMVSHTECMMTSESLCHTDKSNPLAEWKRVTAARPAKYPTESKDTGYHSIGSTASQLGVVSGPLETRLHTHEEDLLEGPSLSMGPVRFTSLHEPDDFIGSASLPPSSTGCLAAPNSAEWASVASSYSSSVGYQTHTYHVGTLDPGGHKDEALDSGQLPEVLKVFSTCAP